MEAARALLTARGMYATERARSLEGALDGVLLVSGAVQAPWNTWLEGDLGDGPQAFATAFVQLVSAPDEDLGARELSMDLAGMSGEMASDPTDWQPLLLLRDGAPVRYEEQCDGTWAVTADEVLPAILDQGPAGTRARWTLPAQDLGQRRYLHLVNMGDAAFLAWVMQLGAI